MTDHPRITSPRPLLPFTVEREECFVVVTPALADKLTRFGLARSATEEDLRKAAEALEMAERNHADRMAWLDKRDARPNSKRWAQAEDCTCHDERDPACPLHGDAERFG